MLAALLEFSIIFFIHNLASISIFKPQLESNFLISYLEVIRTLLQYVRSRIYPWTKARFFFHVSNC